MAGEFTPFLPAVRSKLTGGQPAAGPGGTGSAQFSPVTAASVSPKVTGAPAPAAGAVVGLSAATAHQHGQMNVEIKRDGDRISQIRIQCPCGELIELDCEY